MFIIYKHLLKIYKDKQPELYQNTFCAYALAFAKKQHHGQFRADGVTPYIEHPKMVAEIVKEYVTKFGRQEDFEVLYELVAAAYLHDVMEDTDVSYVKLKKEFGELTAGLVMDVSTVDYDKNEKGKDRYLAGKMVNMTGYALVIKLADRLANVRDSEYLSLERKFKLRRGTENILKYVADRRAPYFSELQSALYEALWEELNTRIPYKIFEGTKFEKNVYNRTSYINPNYVE